MKQKFFNLAKKLTAKSTHHSYNMSCVIVKKNRVVSLGYNQLKTHSKSTHPWHYIHAEFHAMLNTPLSDLQGATAYIYREHKDGSPSLARPCNSCYKMLQMAGIKKICYSSNGSYIEEKL